MYSFTLSIHNLQGVIDKGLLSRVAYLYFIHPASCKNNPIKMTLPMPSLLKMTLMRFSRATARYLMAGAP